MTDETENLFLQNLGKLLAKRRTSLKFKQEYVAEKLGIGFEAVSRMERGLIGISAYRLTELAEIFGCGVEELLSESSNRSYDQAKIIKDMLDKLTPKDRDIIMDTVQKLYERLK